MNFRLLLVGLLFVTLFSPAFAKGRPCVRLLEPGDVMVDVRDGDVTVLVMNLRDKCAVKFSDWLRTAPGQERARPYLGSLGLWVEQLDGKVVSGWEGPSFYHVYSDGVGNYDTSPNYTMIELPAGQFRIKRWSVEKMLSGIDMVQTPYGSAPLPWGTKVMMKAKVTLAIDESRLAGDYSGDDRVVEVVTQPFLYTLPPKPVEWRRYK